MLARALLWALVVAVQLSAISTLVVDKLDNDRYPEEEEIASIAEEASAKTEDLKLHAGVFGFSTAMHQSPPHYLKTGKAKAAKRQGQSSHERIRPVRRTDTVSNGPAFNPSPSPSAIPAPSPPTFPSSGSTQGTVLPPTTSFPQPSSSPPRQGAVCQKEVTCNFKDRQYRTFDGSCNNLGHPSFGRSMLPFRRLIEAETGLRRCGKNSPLPNPREASRATIRRGEKPENPNLSLMVMIFGQIVDHDIELTPPRQDEDGEFPDCCKPENLNADQCCPIFATRDDHFYGHHGRPLCMPFLRSLLVEPAPPRCHLGPDVANANTPWLDGSFIYGSDEERAGELRSFEGGRMKIARDNRNREFPPVTFDELGLKMEFGDHRGDVQPGATVVSTIALRCHNRIADGLRRLHPRWDDERLFQETRKIVVAIFQHISYTQFLEALLGPVNDVTVPESTNGEAIHFYDDTLDGSLSMGFGTAGYRLHTFVSGHYELVNRFGHKYAKMQLRDAFHNPLMAMANNTFDDLIRGLCGQPLNAFDNVFSPEMTEWLFREKEKDWGHDIVSLNVQRGRDHKIPGYPAYREFCGLGNARTWRDLTTLVAPELVHRLAHLYRAPSDVDLYIGGNLERPVRGSVLGPTFHCLVREQFRRLRDADRFFYTNPGQFTRAQLKTIQEQTFSRVICDNADDPSSLSLPRNLFELEHPVKNPKFSCSDFNGHPPLNFNAWR